MEKGQVNDAMLHSFGFGIVNFVCGLGAIKNIDILGRRKILLLTIPFMFLWLMAAALSFLMSEDNKARLHVIALWLFCRFQEDERKLEVLTATSTRCFLFTRPRSSAIHSRCRGLSSGIQGSCKFPHFLTFRNFHPLLCSSFPTRNPHNA
jgi:hypothetical protein